MITGAAGSIGSEMVRQVVKFNPGSLLLVDQAESPLNDLDLEMLVHRDKFEVRTEIADITNYDRMRGIYQQYLPQFIFHAAAYKHVPVMERNPGEAVLCNVLGTRNLADLAVDFGVEKFVMISTDKAVNPTNVMGASKRIAEIYVQSLNNHLIANGNGNQGTRFITTRFGNVLGSNGSVIPLFKKQIKQGGPVTVTHPEITRYFMTIPEACQLVLEAGAMGQGGEIYIFDMGKSIKIVDLARKMIQLSGLVVGRDIEIKYTGLRDGEKLYEELLNTQENTLPTHHPKIMIAQVREEPYNLVKRNLDELVRSVSSNDELYLVSLMKSIVPEFISNSSRFQELDKKRISM
jgi:FlaA1/EpsC-like NDP-sugar epimerase